MNYGRVRVSRKRPRRPHTVMIDVERFEVLGLANMSHWCSGCRAMERFTLDESKWQWNCDTCGHTLIMQQLIIEGLLSESKYRGIESC